jgi:hypothetical protein
MTLKEAKEITGGLSWPSKMPCPSFNLPASKCGIGSELRKIPGTVCSKCYACKGRYGFPNVQNALQKRYDGLFAKDKNKWIEAIVFLINHYASKSGYFRWHDSGDIQGYWHLDLIIKVAKQTPNIKYYLPTKSYLSIFEKIPKNLCIRLSSYYINNAWPVNGYIKEKEIFNSGKYPVSITITEDMEHLFQKNRICQGVKTGNCGTCRMCWNKNIKTVYYPAH